jgi:hypothetical protein
MTWDLVGAGGLNGVADLLGDLGQRLAFCRSSDAKVWRRP